MVKHSSYNKYLKGSTYFDILIIDSQYTIFFIWQVLIASCSWHVRLTCEVTYLRTRGTNLAWIWSLVRHFGRQENLLRSCAWSLQFMELAALVSADRMAGIRSDRPMAWGGEGQNNQGRIYHHCLTHPSLPLPFFFSYTQSHSPQASGITTYHASIQLVNYQLKAYLYIHNYRHIKVNNEMILTHTDLLTYYEVHRKIMLTFLSHTFFKWIELWGLHTQKILVANCM